MTDVKPTSIIEGAIDQDETERVADAYFDAIARHDVDAAVALWRAGGRENVRGQVDTTAPDGVREFLSGLFGPFPDLALRRSSRRRSQDDRAAYRWEATGTFTGTPFQGVEPTGARLDIEGTDVVIVRDGEIVENNAYADGMTVARQLGLMPPEGSRQELAMKRAFNTKTKVGDEARRRRPGDRRRRRLAPARRLPGQDDEHLLRQGRRRRPAVRRRHQPDDERRAQRRRAARRHHARRARSRPRRPPRGRARARRARCSATRTRRPTPRATAASTTSTSSA